MNDKNIIFTENEPLNPRKTIIVLFDTIIRTGLADLGQVSIAVRSSDKFYINQIQNFDKKGFSLKPEDIVVTDLDKNIVEAGNADISEEGDLCLDILRKFPEYSCSICANSFYSTIAASSGLPLIGLTKSALYSKIKNIPIAPEDVNDLSEEEKNIIIDYFTELKNKNEAPIVVMPFRGIITAGKDADEAFSIFCAAESNAKFIIYKNLINTSVLVGELFKKVNEGVKADVNNSNTQPESGNKKGQSLIQEEKSEKQAFSEDINSGPVTVEEKAYRADISAKIFTAEDLAEIIKDTDIKKIIIPEGLKVTEFAEIRADALSIKLIKE